MQARDVARLALSQVPLAIVAAGLGWTVTYNVQVSPRDFALEERDREIAQHQHDLSLLATSVTSKDEEISRLKRLVGEGAAGSSLLAQYGPDVWFYRSVVVTKEKGGNFETCIHADCVKVGITPVFMDSFSDRPGPEPVVKGFVTFPRPVLGLLGARTGQIPLQPGYWGGIQTPDYDYKVLVESVGYERARLGLAIRAGSIKVGPPGTPQLSVSWGHPEPGE